MVLRKRTARRSVPPPRRREHRAAVETKAVFESDALPHRQVVDLKVHRHHITVEANDHRAGARVGKRQGRRPRVQLRLRRRGAGDAQLLRAVALHHHEQGMVEAAHAGYRLRLDLLNAELAAVGDDTAEAGTELDEGCTLARPALAVDNPQHVPARWRDRRVVHHLRAVAPGHRPEHQRHVALFSVGVVGGAARAHQHHALDVGGRRADGEGAAVLDFAVGSAGLADGADDRTRAVVHVGRFVELHCALARTDLLVRLRAHAAGRDAQVVFTAGHQHAAIGQQHAARVVLARAVHLARFVEGRARVGRVKGHRRVPQLGNETPLVDGATAIPLVPTGAAEDQHLAIGQQHRVDIGARVVHAPARHPGGCGALGLQDFHGIAGAGCGAAAAADQGDAPGLRR